MRQERPGRWRGTLHGVPTRVLLGPEGYQVELSLACLGLGTLLVGSERDRSWWRTRRAVTLGDPVFDAEVHVEGLHRWALVALHPSDHVRLRAAVVAGLRIRDGLATFTVPPGPEAQAQHAVFALARLISRLAEVRASDASAWRRWARRTRDPALRRYALQQGLADLGALDGRQQPWPTSQAEYWALWQAAAAEPATAAAAGERLAAAFSVDPERLARADEAMARAALEAARTTDLQVRLATHLGAVGGHASLPALVGLESGWFTRRPVKLAARAAVAAILARHGPTRAGGLSLASGQAGALTPWTGEDADPEDEPRK